MIVINLPNAPSVTLPPEPRSRHNFDAAPVLETASSSAEASGASTPDPSSRRLSRRVQSLAVARLSSREPSPKLSVDPLTGAPLDNRSTDLKALKYDVPTDIAVPTFAQPSKDVDRDLARLYEAVSGARRIAVICGAGISVSAPANIPDFRSAHGLFKKLKEKHPTAGLSSGKDLFDARLFSSESTSSLFYSMVAELKRLADEAEPTIFHRLLKRLDEEGRLQRVYTQNIDGLEEKAGLTFGLGEAGDSTTTVRALGKRKRLGGAGGASNWSRSKSDSHILFAQKQREEEEAAAAKKLTEKPMFPRTIPLHGTLQTLTCALCNYKLVLGNTVHHDRNDSSSAFNASREGSASLGHEESVHALELLQNGEAVPCPRCQSADELRIIAGMRSRGVGRMKVDIVLYGGQNEGAERVGQCLQRDILGLRDPYEPPVPESAAEARARERKEKKEAAKKEGDALKLQQEEAPREVETIGTERSKADMSIDSEVFVDAELGSFTAEESKDDILARAFANDDDGDFTASNDSIIPAASLPEPGRSITIVEPVKPELTPTVAKKRPTRPPRLKPLPPDLLIVAGTSLKVPGTKRIVREFAKACHAQDEWLIYSSEDEAESSSSEDGVKKNKKGGKKEEDQEDGGGSSKKASFRSTDGKNGETEEEEAAEEHEIHDPNTPIRTILLNYDFPNPAREWEDVFDVWVQGDLQRAALSLFPSKTVDEAAPSDSRTIEEMVQDYTWAKYKEHLEEQRKKAKKDKKDKKTAAMPTTLGTGASNRKGKFFRAISASAKMERSGTNSSTASTPPPAIPESSSQPAPIKTAKSRSRSESPVKKRANVSGANGGGGGLKRTSSKKDPFKAGATTIKLEIPATIEQEQEEKPSNGSGKVNDGAIKSSSRNSSNSRSRKKKEVSPSSSISLTPSLSSSRASSILSSTSTGSSCDTASMPFATGRFSQIKEDVEEPQIMVLIESHVNDAAAPGHRGRSTTKKTSSIKDLGSGVKPSTAYAPSKGPKAKRDAKPKGTKVVPVSGGPDAS